MRSRGLAKIRLVAKALVASGAIDEVEEQDVHSKDGDFPLSLRLGKKGMHHSVYILNGGDNVTVSGSIEAASDLDTIDGRIALTSDDSKVCRRFEEVLSDSFDWEELSIFALD